MAVKRAFLVELRLMLMSHSDRPELLFFLLFELEFRCVLMSQSNPLELYVFIFTESRLHLLCNIIGSSLARFVSKKNLHINAI